MALLTKLPLLREVRRDDVAPMEDNGFFGPGSVTWKVWGHATTPIMGLQRAVVVEELDPHLIAAVDATGANYDRPRTRYDRTVRYFAMVAFADSRSVTKAADVLVKVHSKAIGTDPVTGRQYDANDPSSQLWILLTGWHSVLKVYELYGGGRLTEAEEAEYWQQCAIAAQLQTCDPADMPLTREGIQAYFEQMRPHLAVSEAARRMMDHLLNAKVVLPDAPLLLRPPLEVVNWFLRAGVIATMPRWMRRMSGFDQPRVIDWLVRPVLKVGFGIVERSPRLKLGVAHLIAPSVVPVAAPYILGVPALSDAVTTPHEAQARFGYDRPVDAHQGLRARQRDRVFGQGLAPSEEGLIESQAVLGNLA